MKIVSLQPNFFHLLFTKTFSSFREPRLARLGISPFVPAFGIEKRSNVFPGEKIMEKTGRRFFTRAQKKGRARNKFSLCRGGHSFSISRKKLAVEAWPRVVSFRGRGRVTIVFHARYFVVGTRADFQRRVRFKKRLAILYRERIRARARRTRPPLPLLPRPYEYT